MAMEISPTELDGVLLVSSDVFSDFRGLFMRAWCARELRDGGLERPFVQASISVSRNKSMLRGLHYQRAPSQEGKLVRCIGGAVFDVAVDIRAGSPSFGRHFATELVAHDGRAIYIPPGFAHGFQALTDDAQILYMMTDEYAPDLAEGIRWDDAEIGIDWPLPDPVLNERDANYPTLNDAGIQS